MASPYYVDDGLSAFELTEHAVEYLTKAVHAGVDSRDYEPAKRALTALAYLHPRRFEPKSRRD